MAVKAKFKCTYFEASKYPTGKDVGFDPKTGEKVQDLGDCFSARFEPIADQPSVWPNRHHADVYLHYIDAKCGPFVEGQEYTVTVE